MTGRSLRFLALLLPLSIPMNTHAQSNDGSAVGEAFPYPAAPTSDTVDTYHGEPVADPYRPLEDPDSDATRQWVDAENQITFGFLESIPQREAIRQRLTTLWDYPKYGVPDQEGGRFFYSFNTGLQNQSVLYVTNSADKPGTVLLDPNTLTADGTMALSGLAPSHDGRLLAYGLAAAGSDWNEWKIRDVETGEDRDEILRWIKFSGAAWTPDSAGFFYGRFPEPQPGDDLKGANFNQKVYYHRLGTTQADDRLVWKDDAHKDWRADATVSDDGTYLILTIGKGTDDRYRVLYRPLNDWDAEPKHLVGEFDADYTFIDNDGPLFIFRTNKDAPTGRIIGINVNHPEPAAWVELVPAASETLQEAEVVSDHLILTYLKDAAHPGQGPRPEGGVRPRGRIPRPRNRQRIRRQARRRRDVLRLHVVHDAHHDLPLQRRHRRQHGLEAHPSCPSTRPTTRRARSSTPARTARASRCS